MNQSNDNWILQAKVTGKSFSGPDILNALAGRVTEYPLKFLPLFEGVVEVIALCFVNPVVMFPGAAVVS